MRWETLPNLPQYSPDSRHCSLSQGSSEFLLVKTDSTASSKCFLFDSTGVSMNVAWHPDFTWPYQPFLSVLFPLFSGWEHLLKACALLGYFRGCSGFWVGLQGCAHHPPHFLSWLSDFLCSTDPLSIFNHSSQILAVQWVCHVLSAQLPTIDSLSVICFVPLGLYGYFIYLFLMTSAVWVFTFPHITQMESPCPPSVLSGSFCSFCHELGQGAVPSRLLSVDITLWALSVVITVPERNVDAFGGCLNGFPENHPVAAS